MTFLPVMLLTTFISVNGQIAEVPVNSQEAVAYVQETATDIGNPDNLNFDDIESTLTIDTMPTPEPTSVPDVADNDLTDNSAVMLTEMVELLSENSSSVIGTVNSSVLNLMDRMVDSYPDFYRYAGFRTNTDDSYSTTLYLAKKATTDGNTITFSDDCISITFDRYTQNGYSSYIYYDISEAPGASVNVSEHSIVYTDVLEGYPSLGTKTQIPTDYVWIGLITMVMLALFLRRISND